MPCRLLGFDMEGPPCAKEVFLLAKEMRCGYTTGSCAAAGVKAALQFYHTGEILEQVIVLSPDGEQLITVPVERIEVLPDGVVRATVVKDGGDDMDVTHGTRIFADIRVVPDPAVRTLAGGVGVGVVTRPGLSVPVGEAAINPGPRKMIERVLAETLNDGEGVTITIQVPDGEKLAEHTLNPMIGILGGISIIGTSGIVRPMSEDAFKESLAPQLGVVHAAGSQAALLTPGKIGWDLAVQHFGVNPDYIVQTSNFIGYMLEKAVEAGLTEVMLFGHAGKLIKVSGGIFHTHSHVADARQEILAAYLAQLGASQHLIQTVLAANTTEAALPAIEEAGLMHVFDVLAARASERARGHVKGKLTVGSAILALDGRLLGKDATAEKIGGKLGWKRKSL